jgi:dienelactone hydrolase
VLFVAIAAGCGRSSNGASRVRVDRGGDSDSPRIALVSGADVLAPPLDAAADLDLASQDAGLAPLPPDPLFTNLSIPGFPEAVVSVPNGATSRRPVLVVLHGSGDRPDWNCDAWRHITGSQAFVLCPRGLFAPGDSTKDDLRYTHRGGGYLRAHLDAALEALAARFGPYVDADRPVVAGFSLGATEIGQVSIADPDRFPRVAQLEGGHGVWTPSAISAFAAKGGRDVLFGCGSSWCMAPAKAAAARLAKGGVEARVVYANVGHSNDRPLQEALMRELGWFLEGDSRWEVAP